MTFYVNRDKAQNAHDRAAKFLAEEFSMSRDAAEQLISLFYVDKLRSDEYTEKQVPWLEELETKGFGEFGQSERRPQ
jgi:hypothetical protein